MAPPYPERQIAEIARALAGEVSHMPSYSIVVTRTITSTTNVEVDAATQDAACRSAISIARERDEEEWDCEGATYDTELDGEIDED